MFIQPAQYKDRLRHVFWMGGSPCSGKSTISHMLAAAYSLQCYHCDDAYELHRQQITPQSHPTFYRLTHISWDELWMRPVAEQVRDEVALYQEEWPLILADLLALPSDRPIMAEGAALLPDLVAGVLADRRHALWVVPTATFQRYQYPRRGAWVQEVVAQCRDPQQALANWMERDVAFGVEVATTASAKTFHVIQVDGNRSITDNAALVKQHFGLGLPS